MADEDKEKAEKLAAAKKRFEQLKKEQQKKGKKTTGKKKEDKAAKEEAKAEVEAAEAALQDEPGESANAAEDGKAEEDNGDDVEDEDASKETETAERPSESMQSKQRSESFRQGVSGPLSPGAEVQDLYKKQAARIEELEKEGKASRQQQEEGAARLAKAEDELERLREDSSNVTELKSKANEVDGLKEELASVQRQLSQAQQGAKTSNRRQSTASPGMSEQLASKTSTIESLELELSNTRHQFNELQTSISERDASAQALEEKVKAAETATDAYKQELDQLKVSMAFPSDDTKAANEDPEALTKRITILESDLRTANTAATAAQDRATSLEAKIEALTKLHRDATATNNAKDKDLADLRTQLQTRDRPSHVHDASDFELGEDEVGTAALQTRIRALEAENFDLRRGVWRDRRAELQPGMEVFDHDRAASAAAAGEYEDVDLNAPYSPQGRLGSMPRQGSTFQDVLRSGLSAFRGEEPGQQQQQQQQQQGVRQGPTHDRKESLGLLEDEGEGDFDEEGFRLAQEEEGRRRIERVREVKRGLEEWKGWRVDLVGERGEGRESLGGAVFEV
ncbi:hypothetical protein B0A50_07972 [Salinomyces thailandicus]|uniref:M protein repeat protein n=1 Tax=Salinomyces thailandicus TaxID=706561 RepID=A0A4U0TLB3_9PEZI|nr:hypothetical protein B0A50_07972 [Salinomyces thailandica]